MCLFVRGGGGGGGGMCAHTRVEMDNNYGVLPSINDTETISPIGSCVAKLLDDDDVVVYVVVVSVFACRW